jgi:4-hydroxybenzoate polyprenyltransferase
MLGLGWWFLGGMGAAAVQAVWHVMLIRQRGREACFKAFRVNHGIGLAVFLGTAIDLALRG